MQKKGLGERKNIQGHYRLCLTDASLTLVKIGAKHKSDSIEFPVSNFILIKSHLSYFFHRTDHKLKAL